MQPRKGVAATIAALILFTTLVVASETVMSTTGASAEMARMTQLETRESTSGSVLTATEALWLLDSYQRYLQAHPPANCTSVGTVAKYLSTIVVSNSSSSEDSDGIHWTASGTARYIDVAPVVVGEDNLTSLLTPAYAGYSAGQIDLVAVIRVNGQGASVSYSRSETHYLHLRVSASELCPAFDLTSKSLGLVVPLYSYPGPSSSPSPQWTGLMTAKQADPSVPVVAVINPDNGPGAHEDGDFAAAIGKLHEAGIAVLGYVDTAYGAVPLPEIGNEMSSYVSWYHVDGIFLDDMNTSAALAPYYRASTLEARSQGMNYTMANPGTRASAADDSASDSIVEYEDGGLPGISATTNMTGGAIIAYSVSELPPSTWFQAVHAAGVTWVWLTDQSDSYTGLPTYLGQEMQELSSLAA